MFTNSEDYFSAKMPENRQFIPYIVRSSESNKVDFNEIGD